jgi:hypothetical protein
VFTFWSTFCFCLMGERTAATTMASDDATGRDMNALEPGRNSLSIYLAIYESR